jgi:CheY-like chemotaxis protein
MDSGKKILLVEDDADARDLYADVLRSAGFNVVTAVDGVDGLGKAKEGGYSVILLDVMMPNMDGLSFLTHLKETPPPIPNGKVLLLTNLDHDSIIRQGMTLGAFAYLVKSNVTPGQVVDKVTELVNLQPIG